MFVHNEEARLGLYRAKINQIKMMQTRGYYIPIKEREKLKKEYTLEKFTEEYLSNDDPPLLGNVYLNLDERKWRDDDIIFTVMKNKAGELVIVPRNPPLAETAPLNTGVYEFDLVEVENGTIYCLDEEGEGGLVWKVGLEFTLTFVRFPKTIIEKGKVKNPNADSIRNVNSTIPYTFLVNKLYVFYAKPTTQSKAAIQSFLRLQVFIYDDLIIHPLDHWLVPPHQLLDQKEADKIKRVFGVDGLSKLGHNSVIAKLFDARVGDVFKIIRQEKFDAGSIMEKEHYRVVIFIPEKKKTK